MNTPTSNVDELKISVNADNVEFVEKRVMNVKMYLDQFDVVGANGNINCDNLSHMLYAAILNKFKIKMDDGEYNYFREYQERVFDLVENLRDLSEHNIGLILTYVNKINHYLVDIIIMLWCLPRIDSYRSKKIYQMRYCENIKKYNNKLCNLVQHDAVKNFCIETLIKTNNVPVHCIDYIWFYMRDLSLELTFYNAINGNYIGFDVVEANEKNTDEYTKLGINMEYLLGMGLGRIIYERDPLKKGSFSNFLKTLLTNVDAVKLLLHHNENTNFLAQVLAISHNPKKYFGDDFDKFPEEILLLIKK